MAHIEQIPPLPSEREYTHGITLLMREYGLTSARTIDIETEKQRQSDYTFRQHIARAAEIGLQLEPIETDGRIVDTTRAASRNFLRGAAFGTFLVPRVHGDVVPIAAIIDSRPPIILAGKLDQSERQRAHAEYILEDGDQGIASLGTEAENLIDELESRVVPDITKQRFFRAGCGLIALSARLAHQEVLDRDHYLQLEELRSSIDDIDTFNWDQAIRNFFGTPED